MRSWASTISSLYFLEFLDDRIMRTQKASFRHEDYFQSKDIPIKDYTVDGKLAIFEKANIEELIS